MFTQRQTRILAIIAMLVTIVIYQHLLETDRPFCEVPDLNLMYQIQNNKKRTEEIAYDKYLDAEPVNNIFDTFNVTRSVMCNNKAKIIIMVKSFPDNIRQRMAIRKTWGSCRKQDVQLIYLIGSVTHTSGNLMETEIQEFGDILRGSFEDNYYNNIYKTVMAYDWVSSKCKGDRSSEEIEPAIKRMFHLFTAVIICLSIMMPSYTSHTLERRLPDESLKGELSPLYPPWMSTSSSLGESLPSYDIPLNDIIDVYERSNNNTLVTADLSKFSLKREKNKIHYRKNRRKVSRIQPVVSNLSSAITKLSNPLLHAILTSKRIFYWTKISGGQRVECIRKVRIYITSITEKFILTNLWYGNTGILITAIFSWILDLKPHMFIMMTLLCFGYLTTFHYFKDLVQYTCRRKPDIESEVNNPKPTATQADSVDTKTRKTDPFDKSSKLIINEDRDFSQADVNLPNATLNCADFAEILHFEIFRFRTFQHCSTPPASAVILAKNGFYYTIYTLQGEIKCFSCEATYMSHAGAVWANHRNMSPNCRMVRGIETRNKPSSKDTFHLLFEKMDRIAGKCNSLNDYPVVPRRHFHEKPEIPEYKMNSQPRGIAVIINNEQFSSEPKNGVKLEDRVGSGKDADRLEMLFKEMKFEIKIYKDQTAEGIVKIAIEISRTNHRKYDCLIFCILSHGGYTYVYGTQGNICRIKTITEYFNSTRCTSLADKPKLFFIQACQGITTQSGKLLQTDSCDYDGYIPEDDKLERSIPNDADFLMSYATVPGYVSYRCPVEGSWFINSLVKNLRKYRNTDLVTILTIVNNEVSKKTVKEGGNICKQIPTSQSSLRKLVFFR